MKRSNLGKKITAIVLTVLVCFIMVGAIYVNDYYRPTEWAITMLESSEKVEVSCLQDGTLIFRPMELTYKSVEEQGADKATQVEQTMADIKGIIFYPGGKVAYESYAPLMYTLAEQGILCVLLQMPCNLAVLDMNAAEGIPEQFPEITDWYLGGHSLGGSMAASYVAEHAEEYKGLILLASYSTANIADSDLKVLSVYGSEDNVLNLEKYEEYRRNLPADTMEAVIEGGCHAFFGSYGAQEGDGIPTISEEEQVKKTVDLINSMFIDS